MGFSGLVLYAAYQASGRRIRLPHYTGDQIRLGQGIAWADKQPGDHVRYGTISEFAGEVTTVRRLG